jgi:hypothetical protein
MLERAFCDYTSKDRITRNKAKLWLESDDRDPFTFIWILEHLNLIDVKDEILKNIQNSFIKYKKSRPGRRVD